MHMFIRHLAEFKICHRSTYDYGPCVGVTRLERWERAKALDLNPPEEVSLYFTLLVFLVYS